MPLTLARLEEIMGPPHLDDFRGRARDLLRVVDPQYVQDDAGLIEAIAAEMLKVRQETVDELTE